MRFQTKRMLRFISAIFFYIDSIWLRHFAEMRLCALQLSIPTNVCLSCLPWSRQLSRYSSPAANSKGKLASFSAVSCWCSIIWIWRYQRHNTACDDTDLMRLLTFYDQFIKGYRGCQVPAHWCFMRGQVSEADDCLPPAHWPAYGFKLAHPTRCIQRRYRYS